MFPKLAQRPSRATGQQVASLEKQEAQIELIQNEKQATKSLTLAERIQKTQQGRLNQECQTALINLG